MTEIYSSFEPFQSPSREAYVDCQDVRGGWKVERELGRKITRSKQPTCQLFSGHRGVGKSTELLRLQDYLEQQKYFVVYFTAEKDIEPQDAAYADILFACTRHLVEAIKLKNHNPLLEWMKDRWESLKDLVTTEVAFDKLSLTAQVAQFAKITASIRAEPDKRRELRRRMVSSTPSLVDALNDFIKEAEKSLPSDMRGIVLIVDNLDKMVEQQESEKNSNFDEIYLGRSEVMRGLACHVIYTVPISMIYSGQASQLESTYDQPIILPMVMVRNPDGSENAAGVGKIREVIVRRIDLIKPGLLQNLDPPVFDDPSTLKLLCLMSGGHVRNLMQLVQKALNWTEDLPITAKAVRRAIEEARETYRITIQENQWGNLARASHLKQAENNTGHLRLLYDRCLLEYRYYDNNDALQVWCNVHPLIEGIPKFQDALAKVQST